jgi:hypothetical protein
MNFDVPAILTLWQTQNHTTLEIAKICGCGEAQVANTLARVRNGNPPEAQKFERGRPRTDFSGQLPIRRKTPPQDAEIASMVLRNIPMIEIAARCQTSIAEIAKSIGRIADRMMREHHRLIDRQVSKSAWGDRYDWRNS